MSHPMQSNDPTIGTLVHQLTTQVPELIRSELRLAQAEVTQKGKAAGIGIGIAGAKDRATAADGSPRTEVLAAAGSLVVMVVVLVVWRLRRDH